MPKTEVVIRSDLHSTEEVRQALELAREASGGGLDVELRKEKTAFRLDPIITVALITGGATVLSALVSSLVPLLRREKAARGVIRIRDRAGNVVEVPASATPEQVEAVLHTVRHQDVTEVLLTPV